jgi:hypothetical protein
VIWESEVLSRIWMGQADVPIVLAMVVLLALGLLLTSRA